MSTERKVSAEARVGERIGGKYVLHRVLGLGGMAAVYEASHRNGHRVAIKVLSPELAVHASMRDRFLREGYLANSVDHPRVVHVIDDDVADDGSVFLVMELLRGESVARRAEHAGGRLSESEALGITRDLLDVLVVAHARGLVHRDIKPDNLFLAEGLGLKVLDFGIARLKTAALATFGTRDGTLLGTPGFMAPEQALGQQDRIDHQSDLWAVGATLFYLLTGELVHDAGTAEAVLVRTATEPARPLRTAFPAVTAATAHVVDRALQMDKGARWPDASTMKRAVEDALASVTNGSRRAKRDDRALEHASTIDERAPSGSQQHDTEAPVSAAAEPRTPPVSRPGFAPRRVVMVLAAAALTVGFVATGIAGLFTSPREVSHAKAPAAIEVEASTFVASRPAPAPAPAPAASEPPTPVASPAVSLATSASAAPDPAPLASVRVRRAPPPAPPSRAAAPAVVPPSTDPFERP